MSDGDNELSSLPQGAPSGWRGDEHKLQIQAADEAGLPADEVSLALYRKGFIGGLGIRDPLDHAMVLRGRTVLREQQLKPAIRRIFAHLHLGANNFTVRVDDGEFELRIPDAVAQGGGSATEAMRRALLVFVVCGLSGLFFLSSAPPVALLFLGVGLLAGSTLLRRGLKNGRIQLAARLVDELAKLAQREQLILPPTTAEPSPLALGVADGD